LPYFTHYHHLPEICIQLPEQLPESPSHETDACLHEKKLGKTHIKHDQ